MALLFEGVAPPATLPLHASEIATSPVPSRGPTSGRNCYITLVFSGIPRKRDKREVAAEPLPLQSRFMMSHGKKKEKQSQTFNHPCPPVPHIHHHWDLNLGPSAVIAERHQLGHSPSLNINALR